MKRIISTVLVCALLLGCVLTLASCGKMLSGTYSAEIEILGQSAETLYTFKGSKVTIESKVTVLGKVESDSKEGKYSIEDDEITFIMEDKDGKEVEETFSFEQGEDENGKYIKIANIRYNKKD